MKNTILAIALLSAFFFKAQAQDVSNTGTPQQAAILKEVAAKVKENYVFLSVARSLDSLISSNSQAGKYKNLNNEALAAALTEDLRKGSSDKHFYMRYLGESKTKLPEVNSKEQRQQDSLSNSLENFGFETVLVLKGNIGYINYKGFAEANSSEIALAAAMNFVSNTNSLIIDLRENRGGDNAMVILFLSYFFDRSIEPYKTYFRNENKTIPYTTHEKVKGIKYLGRNLYFLTSNTSFSAAEALPYVMQSYHKAKVIGEQTGGAANPENTFIIANKYMLCIPVGATTSAMTKSNWEHTGVTPDLKTTAAKALTEAHLLALQEIQKNKIRTELTETEFKALMEKLKTALVE